MQNACSYFEVAHYVDYDERKVLDKKIIHYTFSKLVELQWLDRESMARLLNCLSFGLKSPFVVANSTPRLFANGSEGGT